MAKLNYYYSTMNSGKSTFALQINYNKQETGLHGLIFTEKDRAGSGVLSSRIGLSAPAIDVTSEMDIHAEVLDRLMNMEKVDYVICDEAQFYAPIQIEQLATIVDNLGIDVFAFGILTDFRSLLFPGSARLVELADNVEALQITAVCWCGEPGSKNSRTLLGLMITEGDQVYVGDTQSDVEAPSYEVLCRKHYFAKKTRKTQR